MTTAAAKATRWHLVGRSLRSHQPSASGWPSAIRRGVLVGLIVAVGAVIGEFGTSATIAIGALNLGLVDPVVPRVLLVKALVSVTCITAVIAFLATGLAGTWWVVALLMVLAYLSGAIGSAGIVAFNTTFMALVTAVLFTNDPGTWSDALRVASLVLIGSLLQCVNTLVAWRYERELAVRRSLVNLSSEMRHLATTSSDVQAAHLATASAQVTAEQLLDGAGLEPSRDELFCGLIDEFRWTRLCLSNWIVAGHPTQTQREQVAARLTVITKNLEKKAHSHQPENGTNVLTLTSGDSTWRALCSQLERLEAASEQFLHDKRARSTRSDTAAAANKRTTTAAVDVARSSMWAMLQPGSTGFRHALRLATAVGVAETVALAFSIERGYWIVLTVVLVVKPDFSTTLTRGLLRIIGTTAAVVLAGAVLNLTNSPQWLMVTLVFLFAPLTMRWMTANYAFASFAIGTTVLLLIEAGDAGGSPILLRLANTLVGAAIGLAAYLLWPRWAGDNIRTLLGPVIESQQRWTRLVLTGLAGGPYVVADVRAAGSETRNRMLVARPAVEATIIEPHRSEVDPAAALALLDSCQQAAMATLALEVTVKTITAAAADTPLHDASVRLLTHVDADFSRARSLVCSDPPVLSPLTNANVEFTSASLVGSNTDTMTWPDQPSTRAVAMLVSSADATVAAARVVEVSVHH